MQRMFETYLEGVDKIKHSVDAVWCMINRLAPGFLVTVTGSCGSFSAGHGHETSWSNPMQMEGQVECKRVGKSVQLPKVFQRAFVS
jgi:hypothetical protein